MLLNISITLTTTENSTEDSKQRHIRSQRSWSHRRSHWPCVTFVSHTLTSVFEIAFGKNLETSRYKTTGSDNIWCHVKAYACVIRKLSPSIWNAHNGWQTPPIFLLPRIVVINREEWTMAILSSIWARYRWKTGWRLLFPECPVDFLSQSYMAASSFSSPLSQKGAFLFMQMPALLTGKYYRIN